MREPSLFERIIAGEIPSTKIWESDEFIAILDVFPNIKWQTLVIPKQRYDSDLSLMPDDVYSRYMLAVKEVVSLLKKWLWVEKIWLIVEWEWVNHAHVKLYPMDMTWDKKQYDKQWFQSYPWYLTSQMGEMKSKEYLDWIAKEILHNSVV